MMGFLTALSCILLVGGMPSQDAGESTLSSSDAFPPVPELVLAARRTPPAADKPEAPAEERIARLIALAREAQDARAAADLRLAAADLAIGEGLEPVVTRALLGLDVDADRRTALEGARAAVGWIAEADEALGGIEADGEEAQAWLDEARVQVDRLRAFGNALAAYLTPSTDDSAYRRSREAAAGLSVMLESDDARIAAAAALWQGAIFVNIDLPDRALAVLDLALAPPPPQDARAALFARLLRCRALAKQGRTTPAMALLYQLEERCEDWFPVEADRGDALRAVTLVAYETLGAWHDALSPETAGQERQWCARTAARLIEERFTPESRSVLRLDRTVPAIATSPEGDALPAPLDMRERPEEVGDPEAADPDG